MMKPVAGRITTAFDEIRPLHIVEALKDQNISQTQRAALEAKLHKHGAIDIAPKKEDIRKPMIPIVAAENAAAFAWCAFRPARDLLWPKMPVINDIGMAFCNYFYDVYGGIIVMMAGGRTHIIAHSWQDQLFDKGIFKHLHTFEEKAVKPFPIHAVYSDLVEVKEGDVMAYVGNQGLSTGKHVHWEIHPGRSYVKWGKRIDPEKWLKGDF